jgi:glutamate-1-semialdehyde aminotransferase
MAEESREEAIKQWAQDTSLREMSEEQLEQLLEKAAADEGHELRIREIEGDFEVAFVSHEAPESIAPEGVIAASAESSSRHEALVGLAEMLEIERIQRLKPES